MSFIDIENVSKTYGNLKAVDQISLKIERNEVFGLLGPNGAGKSTLISMIATLLQPDSGKIKIDNLDFQKDSMKIKSMIGLVPQDIALYPTLSAKENLMFWGKMYGLKSKLLKERVEDALEIAGLKDREKGRIDSFSGGMKRRINIAAALLHHPKLVIMDEPTVGIDPQSRNHILDTVLELNKKGLTVLYTSHYMEEVEFLCSKLAIIDHGKVIATGSKEEIKRIVGKKDIINVKLAEVIDESNLDLLRKIDGVIEVVSSENNYKISTSSSDEVLSKIITLFERNGCKIKALDVEEPNLESVFLHLTGRALRD